MSATTTWALFLTTHAVLVEKIEAALKSADLPSLAWYDVLWALERAPDHRLRMHELAYHVVLTRSNLTRLVDRLETAMLVRRDPATDDRRGAFTQLLPEGQAMRERMWPVYEAQIANGFNRFLSPEDDQVLQRCLKAMLVDARK